MNYLNSKIYVNHMHKYMKSNMYNLMMPKYLIVITYIVYMSIAMYTIH